MVAQIFTFLGFKSTSFDLCSVHFPFRKKPQRASKAIKPYHHNATTFVVLNTYANIRHPSIKICRETAHTVNGS